MTLWLLVWTFAFLGMAGFAVDMTNAYRHQAMLQATADAAAHAALVVLRDGGTEAEARTMAQRVARLNMDKAKHAEVVAIADVAIGSWDGTYLTDSANDNAVYVVARRDDTSQFPVGTLFLHFVGVTDVEVTSEALMVLDYPDCPQDGIFARGHLKFTANNSFGPDLCLHGQEQISVQDFNADPENPDMPDIGENYALTAKERTCAAEANQYFFDFSIDVAPEVDTISITQLTIGINPQGNGPDGLAVLARKDDPDGNSVFEIVAENIIPNSSSVVTAPFTLNLDEVTGIEDLIEFRLVGYDSRFDDSRGWLGLRDNGTPGVFLTIEGGVVPLPATAFMLLTGVAALLGWQTCSARGRKGTQAGTPQRQLAAG
ncbi:MAG: pilus assembly protein TadG-related protein [Pseudomonadota bacterium]